MRKETQEAFDNILNTFGGADGGARFANFMFAIRQLDDVAAKDICDADANIKEIFRAEQVVDIMIKFSKLIDTVNK